MWRRVGNRALDAFVPAFPGMGADNFPLRLRGAGAPFFCGKMLVTTLLARRAGRTNIAGELLLVGWHCAGNDWESAQPSGDLNFGDVRNMAEP